MAHHGHVCIYLYGSHMHVSVSTIRSYLPDLWRKYTRDFPPAELLRPVTYLHQSHENQYTRTALRYLFQYLKGIDDPTREFTLQDCLEKAWNTDGPEKGKRLFLALGRILLPHNFGCNKNIWEAMEMFVTNHSRQILRFDWVEYVKMLDDIDASKRFNMKEVLGVLTTQEPIHHGDLRKSRLVDNLGSRPLKLLNQIIRRRDDNIHQLGTRGVCLRCYNIARAHRALDLNGRREGLYPRWTESSDDDVGLIDQCHLCFSVFGPYSTRHGRALPHARRVRALPHVAHDDNYEIEYSPRVVGHTRQDIIPRFVRPAHQDARHVHWHPRHGRVVEIIS